MNENELEALVTSIGLNAVQGIGKDNLLKLTVQLDPEPMTAELIVSLRSPFQDSRWAAIDKISELEDLFADEGINFVTLFTSETSASHADASAQLTFQR